MFDTAVSKACAVIIMSDCCVSCSDSRLRSTARGNYVIPRSHRQLQRHLRGPVYLIMSETAKVIPIFLSKLKTHQLTLHFIP